MIFGQFQFTGHSLRLRPTVVIVALLLVTFGAYLWAQDVPITVGDGSLFMRSAVAWTGYSDSGGKIKTHPHNTKAMTRVEITMPGHNQTVTCPNNRKCTVVVSYGATDITFATGNNGRGMQVSTDFTQFHRGANDGELLHNDPNRRISRVVVTGGTPAFDNTASAGSTTIVIHYQ